MCIHKHSKYQMILENEHKDTMIRRIHAPTKDIGCTNHQYDASLIQHELCAPKPSNQGRDNFFSNSVCLLSPHCLHCPCLSRKQFFSYKKYLKYLHVTQKVQYMRVITTMPVFGNSRLFQDFRAMASSLQVMPR